MDERTYVEAALPEPFTVLGLRLRPLSIGHLIILHRLGSPFVSPGAESITIGDLALACLVCSQDYASSVSMLDEADLPKQLFKWGQRATRQHGWRMLCPWLYKEIDLPSKLNLFAEYLKYNLEMPCYSVEEGKGREINAPAWQVVRMVLLSKTNLTDTEILDRPYRLSMSDFITLRAIDGQLNLEDASELEEAQKRANEFAAVMAERRKNGNS